MAGTIVFAIVQDPQGFLWFYTTNGIARFDGTHFVNFQNDIHDPESLPGNWATSAVFDRDDQLWECTIEGLDLMLPRGKGFRLFSKEPGNLASLSHSHINCLFQDRDSNLWVGTRNGLNLLVRPSRSFQAYFRAGGGAKAPLPQNDINFIIEDGHGFLWLGTQNGVDLLDPISKKVTHFRNQPGQPKSMVACEIFTILPKANGSVWVGSDGSVLAQFHMDHGRVRSYRHDPAQPKSIGSNHMTTLT